MKKRLSKVILSILVTAIISILIFSSIEYRFLIVALLFVGYILIVRLLFSEARQKAYSRRFTSVYRMIIIPLLILLFISGLLMELSPHKEMAHSAFLFILYGNLAGFSIPVFYRIFHKGN